MRGFVGCVVALIMGTGVCPAVAQFQEGFPGVAPLGGDRVRRYQCGMVVRAVAGPCRGIVGTAPIPSEWPEQEVSIVEEDFSPGTRVTYRTVEGTVRQMVVQIPFLPPGHELRAVVTVEVRRHPQRPPEDPEKLVLPRKRRISRTVRPYLGPSPGVESTSPRIRNQARAIAPDEEVPWKKVEAIYDWVRENIPFRDGKHQGAVATLAEGTGSNEDLVSLFIALCRASGIPARTVWVHRGCYAEFYLEDDQGEGHWFPCRMTGTRSFGQMADSSPILEKGENFRSPQDPRQRKRFLAETVDGAGGRPRVKFIRELVAG